MIGNKTNHLIYFTEQTFYSYGYNLSLILLFSFLGLLLSLDGSDERRPGQSLRRGLLDGEGRGRRHLRGH